MTLPLLNTKADLDALQGTPAYAAAMKYLNGSLTQRVDTATYPAGYGQPGYSGPAVTPVWQDQESLNAIQRVGFASKDEFLAAYSASKV